VSSRWKQGLLALPSVGFSMLPKLACPACWPAYAGLLTSVGLGFLISAVYLLPLTVAFLILALGAMVFRASERHGYTPFLLGMVAASGVLIGKFTWASNLIMYGAVGLLVLASLWNTWPRRDKPNEGAACPDCHTEGF
jgi:mercuric ion transport protein